MSRVLITKLIAQQVRSPSENMHGRRPEVRWLRKYAKYVTSTRGSQTHPKYSDKRLNSELRTQKRDSRVPISFLFARRQGRRRFTGAGIASPLLSNSGLPPAASLIASFRSIINARKLVRAYFSRDFPVRVAWAVLAVNPLPAPGNLRFQNVGSCLGVLARIPRA